jgi:hypothetical protein
MARANLRGLIGNLGDTETLDAPLLAAAPIANPVSPRPRTTSNDVTVDDGPARSKTGRADNRVTADARSRPRDKAALEGVRFSDFQRKETRLRIDQQDALTEHARRLNRAKGAGGQRITDNTLIRVAVDLLLAKADRLAGHDETALRRSIAMREGDA